MLQSEFFERTGVTLTGEEYAEVETVYNSVTMQKDDFCAMWKKSHNNRLFKEMMDAMNSLVSEFNQRGAEIKRLNGILEEKERFIEEERNRIYKAGNERLLDFAKKVIVANSSETAHVYDVIEEEFGIAFIIRTKREAGITLSDAEIDYMVGKL